MWNPNLPFDAEQQLHSRATVDHPGLIGIQQERQDNCMVCLEFGLQTDTASFPHNGV